MDTGAGKEGGVSDRCRLYLITPPALEPAPFAESLKRALGAGDVASLQLRLKGASDVARLAGRRGHGFGWNGFRHRR